jgi:hypothetical protein
VPPPSIVPVMHRSTTGLRLGVSLAGLSGFIWFIWSLHDFGHSCGTRLPGRPSGPTAAGDILLIALPPLVVAVVQWLQTQSWRRTFGYGALTAVFAAFAVAAAVVIWVLSRCTD